MSIQRGWYELACWNALSTEQQTMLIEAGVLYIGHWDPQGGTCENGAEVAVETMHDKAPGARFYCRRCAIKFLEDLNLTPEARKARARARGEVRT